ncbi:hypothetical protein OIV83_003767 [Microbotryomycetes sp. JL201]|nr:hypothetical protein OIV83_003767 [Microbotryomycetes sp. JL201]
MRRRLIAADESADDVNERADDDVQAESAAQPNQKMQARTVWYRNLRRIFGGDTIRDDELERDEKPVADGDEVNGIKFSDADDDEDERARTLASRSDEHKPVINGEAEGKGLFAIQLELELVRQDEGSKAEDEDYHAFMRSIQRRASLLSQDVVVKACKLEHHETAGPVRKSKYTTSGLLITTPASSDVTSRTKLLTVDSLDFGNALAVKNATTLNGNIVRRQGESSVLDAAIFLALHDLAHVDAQLSCAAEERHGPIFKLSARIYLKRAFFEARYYSVPRQLIVEYLFPSADDGDHEIATVNLFYESLVRAPRTSMGLPVSRCSSQPAEGHARTQESEEERVARLGRQRKGKRRAFEPEDADGDDDSAMSSAPEIDIELEDELIKPVGLEPTLLPFQSRSVRWMLAREGKRVKPKHNMNGFAGSSHAHDRNQTDGDDGDHSGVNASPDLEDLPEDLQIGQRRGPMWERLDKVLPDGTCQTFFVNRVQCALAVQDPGQEEGLGASGNGLLAEEVGLGKTVEVIALILLHQQPERARLPTYFNAATDTEPQPTGLTLIISPPTLTGQWQAEIAKHAPCLRVLRYDGIKKVPAKWTAQDVASSFDVVLTTYDVLRREVAIARKPHERALRSSPDSRPKYRRSLLVSIDWLRVIMDEAQLIGEGFSAASETASLVPRLYSFAVTSTPLRARIEDFNGILSFLRLEPFSHTRHALPRLLADTATFKRVCRQIGARTMKANVEHELILPDQARFVVPVEFSAVEKYWYDAKYLECLDALGLQQDGSPKDQGVDPQTGEPILWQPKAGDLNRALVNLRQICCHPQVGHGAKVALGGVLKTVEEVLMSMKDKAVSALMSDTRQLLDTRVRRGQLMCYDPEDCERFETALELYQSTLLDLKPAIDDIITKIKDCYAARQVVERARHSSPGAESDVTTLSDHTTDSIVHALGLGMAEEEDDQNSHRIISDKERALTRTLGTLRNRLRDFLFIEHNALFFSGNAYFNMGKFPEEEAEMYRRAEQLRVKILTPWEKQVDAAIKLLRKQMRKRDMDAGEELTIDDIEFHFGETRGGILAREAYEDAENTIDILNGYGQLLWSWREQIFEWMSSRVSIAGDDATGEEYAERAELQEKLNCFIEAYTVLLAEWRHAITGEKSALADQLNEDLLGLKKSEWGAKDPDSKRRRKKYIPFKERRVPSLEQGDTPEDVLRFELLRERVEARGSDNEEVDVVPLRATTRVLLEAKDRAYRSIEIAVLKQEAERLKQVVADKEKLADRFRDELTDITKAFNARLNYFAQLQTLSDAVADPNLDPRHFRGFMIELEMMAAEEDQLEMSIKAKESSRRYLESLSDGGGNSTVDATCVICSDTYTRGALTTCGHLFCHSCFTNWYNRQRTCALCKRNLKQGDWEVVKYRHARQEDDEEDTSQQMRDGEYDTLDASILDPPPRLNTMSEGEFDEIDSVATAAPFSSKSNFIVKHLRYIRSKDPTAKIVLFSAWQDSLDILCRAFSSNGIKFVRLEGSGNRLRKEEAVRQFVEDPDVAVFLLHTKSQSAGLNLTVARYVCLVEPLLHPSLEIQAVARVHRIGQKNDTTVYQYFVSDSVDQRVAELRARNNTSLFTPKAKRDTAQESRISQRDMSTTGKGRTAAAGGDEAMDDEDEISRCLFKPEHYLNLQRALLPVRLRGVKRGRPDDRDDEDEHCAARRRAGLAALGRAVESNTIRRI